LLEKILRRDLFGWGEHCVCFKKLKKQHDDDVGRPFSSHEESLVYDNDSKRHDHENNINTNIIDNNINTPLTSSVSLQDDIAC
jgi:hypothetical protein